jgi:hypothetical protein
MVYYNDAAIGLYSGSGNSMAVRAVCELREAEDAMISDPTRPFHSISLSGIVSKRHVSVTPPILAQ